MEIKNSEILVNSLREVEKRNDVTAEFEPPTKKVKKDIDSKEEAENKEDISNSKDSNVAIESSDCIENVSQESTTNTDDPYAYLDRGDFSSERFKLELCNLPKRFGLSQLRKKLVHLSLKPCKIKSVTLGSFAFVTFRTEEDRDQAIETLQGYEWKSRSIKVKMASAIPDPLMVKRKSDKEKRNENVVVTEKKEVHEDEESRVNATVAPLWRMPYEEQLKLKQEAATECFRKISKDIYNNNKQDAEYINSNRSKYDGVCCCLHPIKPSPLTHGYRNKCEFTIGRYGDQDNSIGFRVGCYKNGDLGILPVHSCTHVPQAMKKAVEELGGYLKERSDMPSFDAVTRKGYWKQVVVRTASCGGGGGSSGEGGDCSGVDGGGSGREAKVDSGRGGDDGVGGNVVGGSGSKDTKVGVGGNVVGESGSKDTKVGGGGGGVGGSGSKDTKVGGGGVGGSGSKDTKVDGGCDGGFGDNQKNIDNTDISTNNITNETDHFVSDNSSSVDNGNKSDNNSINENTTTTTTTTTNNNDDNKNKNNNNYVDNKDNNNDGDTGVVKKHQLLLTLVCHPQNLTEAEKDAVVESFRAYYKLLLGASVVTSLHFQYQSDRKDVSAQDHTSHILGDSFITEQLLHMHFRISPLAFFQVNTRAAEVLYQGVGEMCGVGEGTTLVDVCCGTGTIGLTMAKSVKKVIGIEVNRQAVEDARINASINGVTNAEFICGRVEDVLDTLLKKLSRAGGDVVVVVDPPRAGLHSSVVKAIRRVEGIKRLVYVACKLSAAASNIVDFTRQISKRTQGRPFRLMQASIVDLFPMTHMYETIMLLERQ